MNEYRDNVRAHINQVLKGLDGLLTIFPQTTHGRGGPCDIVDVAESLHRCYRHPSAYSVSDLAQAIRLHLKESE